MKAFTDAELLAFLDGEADPEISKELENSPELIERLEKLSLENKRNLASFYRLTCPDSMEIGEYYLGLLPLEKTSRIETHLKTCPHCAEEFANLKDLAQETRTKKRLFPKPASKPGFGSLAPGFEVRGGPSEFQGDNDRVYVYEVGEMRISLEILDDLDNLDQKELLGLIESDDSFDSKVMMMLGETLLGEEAIDSAGNFIFSNLSPNRYTLILSTPDTEIIIQSLKVE